MKNKKIILAISGSIAAYKAAFLTRLFIKAGAEVQVLMTPAATKFIAPLTLSTLSKREVHTQVTAESSWNNHVELGLWADALVVAPATANTLAKMSNGICDNIISAVYLSARCPVFIAPAMDLDMWVHPATTANVNRLQSYGNHLIPVGHGELASGLVGAGRMAEPEDIVSFLQQHFDAKQDLKGKKAIVTAGPTYEPLDPVRFIGNHSTGRMGISIAEELAARGAIVTLILGPTNLKPQNPKIELCAVKTAEDMFIAATERFETSDIAILSAAVADYRPATISKEKIKKKDNDMSIPLMRTKDIAAYLGKQKHENQLLIGFALETHNELKNAQKKLTKKNFDFIVLNSLNDKGAGFKHNTNKVTFFDKNNNIEKFELKTKVKVAKDIVDKIVSLTDTI